MIRTTEPQCNATLEVVPGPRMRIGEVAILGLDRVDTGTVRGLLRVKPYDLFRRDLLYQSQRDLYGLGVFRSVSVLLADSVPPTVPGDTLVGIVVHVAEGPGHRVLTGVGYGTIDCFRLQEGWTAYNYLAGRRPRPDGPVSKIGVGNPLDAGFRTTRAVAARRPDIGHAQLQRGTVAATATFISSRHSRA